MPRINEVNYVTRPTKASGGRKGHASWRDWYFVKHNDFGKKGTVYLGNILIPEEYIGKKVRFRLEVLKDEEHEEEMKKEKQEDEDEDEESIEKDNSMTGHYGMSREETMKTVKDMVCAMIKCNNYSEVMDYYFTNNKKITHETKATFQCYIIALDMYSIYREALDESISKKYQEQTPTIVGLDMKSMIRKYKGEE